MYNRENFRRCKAKWTKAEVLNGVRSACLDMDPPMSRLMYEQLRKTDPCHLPSAKTVVDYLSPGGSWTTAMQVAGCPVRKRGRAGQTQYLMDQL